MMMRLTIGALFTALVSMCCSAYEPANSAAAVDFENDLIPVFTKLGCNAGACHGAAVGRGGFKLSLYGGNPAADYQAIVRQLEGRRVNLQQPRESLIVLKPTESLAHGGGFLIDDDDESARLLLDWITQGAAFDSSRKLSRVDVTPQKHVAKKVGEQVNLRATAHYSDGSQRDVSRWTVFAAEDSSAVEVKSTSMSALRRGRHIVVARFLTEVVPIELIVPLSDARPNVDQTSADNDLARSFIDDEINSTLQTLGLSVSPAANDATFLRRVTLDLTGRLPSPDQVTSFLVDEDPHKRSVLVDRLLQSEEFTEYWTLQLAQLLRIRASGRGQYANESGATVYHAWLAEPAAQQRRVRHAGAQLDLGIGRYSQERSSKFLSHRLRTS